MPGEMLRRFLKRPSPVEPRSAHVPAGRRIYAIGDIHGRADLLLKLHDRIEAHAKANPAVRHVLVYLGDYIDRGTQSRDVLELLIDGAPDGFETVHLLGNHEQAMLQFLEDTSVAPVWFANGGLATLLSFGVSASASVLESSAEFARLQAELTRALSPRQLDFLKSLKLTHTEGDYLFVHAGIRPGVPLDRQSTTDLIWIRQQFLLSPLDHGKIVVHGHSVTAQPDIRANRIGIDTGAYATGHLSCLVLEGSSRAFLQT